MTRTPLRPLIRILEARARGENPDRIERENRRARHERLRDRLRLRAESRLLVLAVMFAMLFISVTGRMAVLSSTAPVEPSEANAGPAILAQRADITDRRGRILATNLATNSLYAQPQMMIDREGAARKLAAIFPELDAAKLLVRFSGKRRFLWIRRKISPEQQQLVHDIGEPGLLFGPREMRLYPNGNLAAHVLGGARFGREGVRAAEVVGMAGVEQVFDADLRDPARAGAPLALSIDLTVQAAVREVLAGGMKIMNAKGAAAVLMDVNTGEVLSLVSLPDFDPNDRPAPAPNMPAAQNPLFNRAVQGLYELGSTFKIFTAAQALDESIATPETMVDTRGPLEWGAFRIRDFHDVGPALTLTDVIVKSSNVGAARLAMEIGADRQREFLGNLGLLHPLPVELAEAPSVRPIIPDNWSELSAMTISYGHGLSVSPLHLAAAYASLANGGTFVAPTLLRVDAPPVPGARVVSNETSLALRRMLRQVVTRGTASLGDVPGYMVGGKTGSADKPDPQGGYYDDRVIATFASIFPADAPKYTLIVMLDEPEVTMLGEVRRTAGWTAVPVSAEMIRRVAPLLGMRPRIEPAPGFGLMLTGD